MLPMLSFRSLWLLRLSLTLNGRCSRRRRRCDTVPFQIDDECLHQKVCNERSLVLCHARHGCEIACADSHHAQQTGFRQGGSRCWSCACRSSCCYRSRGGAAAFRSSSPCCHASSATPSHEPLILQFYHLSKGREPQMHHPYHFQKKQRLIQIALPALCIRANEI